MLLLLLFLFIIFIVIKNYIESTKKKIIIIIIIYDCTLPTREKINRDSNSTPRLDSIGDIVEKMHATVMSWCLFALMITGCCRLVSSQVTIGFTSGDRDGVFLVMENETAEVCIAANFSNGADSDKTVRTAYMSRSAVGKLIELAIVQYRIYIISACAAGMDFNDTQIALTLSTSMPQTCFSIVLINDNIFEARREEFFVNITTSDNSVTLMPNFIAVNINDDDCKLVNAFFLPFPIDIIIMSKTQ